MQSKKISPNRVLRPKLLNSPFASCSLTNLDFLIPQSAHFDYIINLPFFVIKIFEFKFFFCTSRNKSACSLIKYMSKEKNVLLTVLTHTCHLFYQKMFCKLNILHILTLLLLFSLILRLVFLDVYIQCVFYSFYDKYHIL